MAATGEQPVCCCCCLSVAHLGAAWQRHLQLHQLLAVVLLC